MSLQLNYQNLIDGAWVPSATGRTYQVTNPADLREVLHEYPKAGDQDVARAVSSAAEAQKAWKTVPIAERAAILRRVSQKIREERQAIAEIITAENGKLLSESLVEIDSAILELDFQIGEGERQAGTSGDNFKSGHWSISRKEPLGVVCAIIPWNFPFNVP